MRHEGLNAAAAIFDMGINRLTIAIITAAIPVASAIVIGTLAPIEASMGELYSGGFATALAALGCKIGVVFGAWIIWDIVRHGRHK